MASVFTTISLLSAMWMVAMSQEDAPPVTCGAQADCFSIEFGELSDNKEDVVTRDVHVMWNSGDGATGCPKSADDTFRYACSEEFEKSADIADNQTMVTVLDWKSGADNKLIMKSRPVGEQACFAVYDGDVTATKSEVSLHAVQTTLNEKLNMACNGPVNYCDLDQQNEWQWCLLVPNYTTTKTIKTATKDVKVSVTKLPTADAASTKCGENEVLDPATGKCCPTKDKKKSESVVLAFDIPVTVNL